MKLPQVTYGPVQSIATSGTLAVPVQDFQRQQSIVHQAADIFKDAYVTHAKTETANLAIGFKARLAEIEKTRTDNANRMIDAEELRANGIPTDASGPVKGSLYAAPLYEAEAKTTLDEMASQVPPMFRQQFIERASEELASTGYRVFAKTQAWKQDEGLADLAANKEVLELAGDWQGVRDVLHVAHSQGIIDGKTLQQHIQNTDVAEAQAPALAAIAGESQTKLEEEIVKLSDPEYSGPLDAKARGTIVTALEQRRATLAREFEKVDIENKLQQFGDMEVGVTYAEGKDRLTPVHIERAFRREQITTSQRNQLTMQYWARIEREKKAHGQLIDVEDAMKHGVKLSHSDKDHKKGVDVYTVSQFGTSIEAQKGTPEQRAFFERGNAVVAANTGILSEEGKAYMIGMNRSGDPEKVVQAANFYSQLLQVAPQTLGDVPERDRVRLEVTAAMASSGVPAAVAMKYGQEAADRPPEQQAEIKATYAAAIKSDGTSNSVSLEKFLGSDNTFDPFFGAPAASNTKIRTEYDSLVQTFFGQTGDLSLARDMAQARVRETWGRSEINGTPQAIKYAPEVRTGRPTKELRAEIESQISTGQYTTIAGSVGGAPVPVDPAKVIVTSDTRTGKDNRYALQVIRPDGMLDNVYTLDGKQAYWNPMPEAKTAAELRKQEALTAGKAKREAMLAPPTEDFGGN